MLAPADLAIATGPSEGWTAKPGPTQLQWRGLMAESRCDYRGGDNETAFVALNARVSVERDRDPREIRNLLAREGYRIGGALMIGADAQALPASLVAQVLPALEDGFWAHSGTPGGTRDELHVFLRMQLPADAGGPQVLFAQLVLFAQGVRSGRADAAAEPAADADLLARVWAVAASGALEQMRALHTSLGGRGDGAADEADAGAEPDAASLTLDGGADAGASAALEAFAERAALVLCDKIAACCTVEQQAGGVAADRSVGCKEAVGAQLAVTLSSAVPGVAAGRAIFDVAAAQSCLDALAAASCTDARASAPGLPCAAALTPRVDVGGDCTSAFDCTTGYCRWSDGHGLCVAQAPTGAPCDVDSDCSNGNTCARDVPRVCSAAAVPSRSWCQGP